MVVVVVVVVAVVVVVVEAVVEGVVVGVVLVVVTTEVSQNCPVQLVSQVHVKAPEIPVDWLTSVQTPF